MVSFGCLPLSLISLNTNDHNLSLMKMVLARGRPFFNHSIVIDNGKTTHSPKYYT
jgi:hypothetical protein